VTLQCPNRFLLERGWLLVKKATHHQPQQRPTMPELYKEISQWPECQLPGAADARAMLTEEDPALACWRAIQHLRQTLTAQDDGPQPQTRSRKEQPQQE